MTSLVLYDATLDHMLEQSFGPPLYPFLARYPPVTRGNPTCHNQRILVELLVLEQTMRQHGWNQYITKPDIIKIFMVQKSVFITLHEHFDIFIYAARFIKHGQCISF